MSVSLVRLDDRLIHGQVTVGWAPALDIACIVLANDEVAGDEWEQTVYRGGTSADVDVLFHTVTGAAEAWRNGDFDDTTTLILVESTTDALQLLNSGAPLTSLNIGGLHHRADCKKVLSYVFVDETDMENFRQLSQKSIELECRDTPHAKKLLLDSVVALSE
jgi:mannose/fructose/N-acetylgalactosamine-specific phosphotransferase system component IIB